jgi:uncharacterized protein (DUF2252 family)
MTAPGANASSFKGCTITNTSTASITRPDERGRSALWQRGRSLRQSVRRSDQGGFEPATDRDPVGIIEAEGKARLQEYLPVRHGRMLESPFAFFRGAAAVMAADLAPLPHTQINVQACGDAHLLNFGLYATPERHLVFDLNDFDESLPAPWEWDVKRLAASFELAARSIGLSPSEATEVVRAGIFRYCDTLRELSEMSTLEVWYSRVDAEDVNPLIATKAGRVATERVIAKAKTRTQLQAFDKLTAVVDGKRVVVDDPPLVQHVPELTTEVVVEFLAGYQATLSPDHAHLLGQYRLVDAALKVVGVGSVGTRCFVVVGEGPSDLDPLLLQVKEAEPSVMEPFAGPSGFGHPGERVVAGQRLMQAASDIFLGWSTGPQGRFFYVRQLRDMKGSATIETMTLQMLTTYSRLCGETLARAHARSLSPALLAGYCGGGDQLSLAMAAFARRYADQTERDHEALAAAVRSGRLPAELGV